VLIINTRQADIFQSHYTSVKRHMSIDRETPSRKGGKEGEPCSWSSYPQTVTSCYPPFIYFHVWHYLFLPSPPPFSSLPLSFLFPSFPSPKHSFSRPYLRLSRGGVPSQDSSVSRSTIPIPTSKAVVNRRATASNDTDQA